MIKGFGKIHENSACKPLIVKKYFAFLKESNKCMLSNMISTKSYVDLKDVEIHLLQLWIGYLLAAPGALRLVVKQL